GGRALRRRQDRRPPLLPPPLPPAGQARAASDPPSRRAPDAGPHLPGHPRPLRDRRRGPRLRALGQDRAAVARGRRPRPEAAQAPDGLVPGRAPGDGGKGGTRLGRPPPLPMKIATFNINSVKRRLPNLLEWLQAAKPDVVCLQELKA